MTMKAGEGWKTLYTIDSIFKSLKTGGMEKELKIASFAEIQKGKWCKW